MKVFIKTFGCKLNIAESHAIQKKISMLGFVVSRKLNDAKIVIINSCHVTQKSWQRIEKYLQTVKTGQKIILTGCFPTEIKKGNSNITYFDSKHKKDIPSFLQKLFPRKKSDCKVIQRSTTRGFIKIQSGCKTGCAYCIIPAYRGKPTSVSPKKIISEINELVYDGCKEVVLTGTNLGKYSYQQINLTILLDRILRETSIIRLRVSSIDITDINLSLLEIFKKNQTRLCPHFHLALQSGSDKILQKMRRPYTFKQYFETCQKIYKTIPSANITTDIIVGFPGETNNDFFLSCKAVKKCQFLKVHVFSYSNHPQTISAKLSPKVQKEIIKKRHKTISHIAKITRFKRLLKFVNHTYPVLFEQKINNYHNGYTPNYIHVKKKSTAKKFITNQIIATKLTKLAKDTFIA